MIITVNSKNEYKFYPAIGGENDALTLDRKFCVVLRRLSPVMHSGKWANIDAESGKVDIDITARVRVHIVRLENAPTLTDENGNAWELTIEDLTGAQYPELYPVISQINDELSRFDEQASGVDEKK